MKLFHFYVFLKLKKNSKFLEQKIKMATCCKTNLPMPHPHWCPTILTDIMSLLSNHTSGSARLSIAGQSHGAVCQAVQQHVTGHFMTAELRSRLDSSLLCDLRLETCLWLVTWDLLVTWVWWLETCLWLVTWDLLVTCNLGFNDLRLA